LFGSGQEVAVVEGKTKRIDTIGFEELGIGFREEVG